MLVGGLIEDQIHQDADTAAMRLSEQSIEIAEGAEPRIDIALIRHIVPKIFHGRGVDRGQPDGIDTK